MISPWATILISLSSAILTALLTPFATAHWQHRFWKRQKREEMRLAEVTEVNQLAAEFKTNYLLKDMVEHTTRAYSYWGRHGHLWMDR